MNELDTLVTRADDDRTLARLRARLTDAAEDDGLAEVTYRTADSPFGPLLVAATERGLVRLAYAVQDHDAVLTELAADISPRVLAGGRRLDPVLRELDEYFERRRRVFDLAVDLRLATTFRREVLEHLRHTAYGSTETYGTVATLTGHPRASRAVGSACATNPVPIVVPCHRVLRGDGSLGGYLGGLAGLSIKQTLLDLESAA